MHTVMRAPVLLFSLSTRLHYGYVTFPGLPDYVLLTIVRSKKSTHTLTAIPVFTNLLIFNKRVCVHVNKYPVNMLVNKSIAITQLCSQYHS